MDLSVVPYSHISPSESECAAANHSKDNINSNNNATKVEKNGHGRVVDPVEAPQKPAKNAGIRYQECLRNHAASIGGHANDGCGEFMPAGGDGTIEALKCAACGCHRNFHRKEVSGCEYPVQAGFCYNAGPGWDYSGKKKMGFPALPPILPHIKMDLQQRSQSAVENKNSEEQDQAAAIAARKRFRTKFTNEQKDKMLAFAEKLGWRIQKHDDVALQQFCMEVGVKRHVLKVWMHNNKNTLGKKETLSV